MIPLIVLVILTGIDIGPAPRMLDGYGHPMPANCIGRLGSTFLLHPGLQDVTMQKDKIVSIGKDAYIRFWDIETGKNYRKIRLPAGNTFLMKISNSISLSCIVYENSILIINNISETILLNEPCDGTRLVAICFSPDESEIAILKDDGAVTVFNHTLATTKEYKNDDNIRGQCAEGSTIRYSGDGKYILIGALDRGISFYQIDSKSMKLVDKKLKMPGSMIGLFSSQMKVATYEQRDDCDRIFISDPMSGKIQSSIDMPTKQRCNQILLSKDEKLLIVVGEIKIEVIDLKSIRLKLSFNRRDMVNFNLSDDGSILIGGGWSCIHLFKIALGKEILANSRAIDDGRSLIQVDEQSGHIYHLNVELKSMKVWDIDSARMLADYPIVSPGDESYIDNLSMCRRDNRLIRILDGNLLHYNYSKKSVSLSRSVKLEGLGAHFSPTVKLHLPDSVVGIDSATIRTWSMDTGKSKALFRIPEKADIDSAILSNDASQVALAVDGVTRIYNLATGLPSSWSVPNTGIYHFSPDGSLFAMTSRGPDLGMKSKIKVYSVDNGTEVLSVEVESLFCHLLFDKNRNALHVASDMKLRSFSLVDGRNYFEQCLGGCDCKMIFRVPNITSLMLYKNCIIVNFDTLPTLVLTSPTQRVLRKRRSRGSKIHPRPVQLL